MAQDARPTDDALPIPATTARFALRVRPADRPLEPASVTAHLHRLHGLGGVPSSSRLARLLGRSPSPPVLECRLYAPNDSDATLRYEFAVDDQYLLAPLERTLRGLFPDGYEFERVADPRDPVEVLLDGATTHDCAAVEYRGDAERRRDWQGALTPFERVAPPEGGRVPLADVVETMAAADGPVVYQALLVPYPDWSKVARKRVVDLEGGHDTVGGQLSNVLWGEPSSPEEVLTPTDEVRLAELEDRDARRSFAVTARAVAIDAGSSGSSEYVAQELASALDAVGGTVHAVEGAVRTGRDARSVLEAIVERTPASPRYGAGASRLPYAPKASPAIVADPSEVGSFCLIGGPALTAAGTRAVATTPGERVALSRPPRDQLAAYHGPGLTLGHPLTRDGSPDPEPIALPPSLQPLHAAWFGKTGSGKSTAIVQAMLDNHTATDGASILIDPKGDGMALDYCRAHLARFGSLEDVVYFDCATVLPAFSFFDIRDDLRAGVPRTTAVEDRVDHYVEVLMAVMGPERFEQAVRSPDVIRYLVKALFDPVNGTDAFGHDELHEAARLLHERQAAPSVADPDLEAALAGVVANRARTFDEIMAGVANRIEKIPVDRRLARIFNHVPDVEGDPHFDLAQYLDSDIVVIVDTGGLRAEAQRVLALVVLSNLWSALRRRTRRAPDVEHPLVNVYLEEAASVAVSDLLAELLAHARGFACAVTLSMQFPGQLRDHDGVVYEELLNDVSTIVTGNVPADARLAERFATDDMPPNAVGNRLRALRRGQWLVTLPAAFDSPEPRPFLVGSGDPPRGTEGAVGRALLDAELEAVRERTLTEAGLTLTSPGVSDGIDEEVVAEKAPTGRVDSALPYTRRLPMCMWYDPEAHALRCLTCDSRYDPDVEGMRRAIACHSSMKRVDRDEIPICDVGLKLTPEERRESDFTDRQLMFLQAVYNAQQLRYDPLEYELVWDSMLRLQEYVGIDADAVQDLLDAGLLRLDTEHPHKLYSVTPDARRLIGEHYREGVDYGHGRGDLEETSEHVFGVEVGLRWARRTFVEEPDSPVVEVVPYYELGENRRLDIAGLNGEGEIVMAVEVERINHDKLQAIPDDFDKMASCDVEEAVWIVMTREGGHTVLEALRDPPDGEPRVEKEYSPNTPPNQFTIETPGLTAVYTAQHLRRQLEQP